MSGIKWPGRIVLVGLCCLLLGTALTASAHGDHGADNPMDGVAFEQHLDAQVDLDLPFRDESGAQARLGDYLAGEPAILLLGYFDCDMLCSVALPELTRSVGELDDLRPGADFEVLVVSIDPDETAADAAARKEEFVSDSGEGWHFLSGEPDAIESLTNTAGFHYAYDAEQDEFAHPSGLVFLTAAGQISHYLYGIDYDPDTLRLNLIDASGGRIGSPVDQLLLRCYQYDPITGQYTFAIEKALRFAGMATVGVLGLAIFGLMRREKREKGKV